MTMKVYTDVVAGKLPELFVKKVAFNRAFGGEPQVITGSAYDNKFLKIKTDDTDSVIQDYNTDPDVGMGAGSGDSSRLGEIKEIKTTVEEVEFLAPKVINEGIDTFTVGDNMDEVAAGRFVKHAQAWAKLHEGLMGEELSEKASRTLTVELTEASIVKAFNDAYVEFVNNEVSDSITWIAYVTPEVHSIIVDSKLAITAKGSDANVTNNTVTKFKGFELEVIANSKFKAGEVAYFTAENVGAAAVALKEARAMDDHPNFFGLAVQSAAKFGKFIPAKNSKAILKAVVGDTEEVPAG